MTPPVLHAPLTQIVQEFGGVRAARESLTTDEQRRAQAAARALDELGPGASYDDVFRCVGGAVDFVGGSLAMSDSWNPADIRGQIYQLPSSFLAKVTLWQGDPDPSPVVLHQLAPGTCAHPFEVAPERLIRALPSVQDLYPRHGDKELFCSLVVSREHSRRGTTIKLITLFQPRNRPAPEWKSACRMLEVLHGNIERSLAAAALPCSLASGEADFVFVEQNRGLLLADDKGRVSECNQRAIQLLESYLPGLWHEGWSLDDLVAGLISRTSDPHCPIVVAHRTSAAYIEAHVHQIPDPTSPKRRVLVVLSEHMMPVAASQAALYPRLRDAGLTSRQGEVAELLISTDLSVKEIAAKLDCATGTAREHVKAIHRALGVHSRLELIARFAAPAPR